MLNWKQNIGAGNLTPEKVKVLLKNFRYPTEIDQKGRLLIDTGTSKFVMAFRNNGEDSTIIGVSHFKMKAWAFLLFVVFLFCFVVPGFLFVMIVNHQRKKVYIEAVRLINTNLNNPVISNTNFTMDDPAEKIKKIKQMFEDGLISEEDFKNKKEAILAKY